MTREQELREAFAAKREVLRAWGLFISRAVRRRFRNRETAVKTAFWAVPPAIRVKDLDSFITKALYRVQENKEYADPLTGITDQVGVRFVTLLQSNADEVVEFILSSEAWSARIDRSFKLELPKNPKEFDYVAVHIHVEPVADTVAFGHVVPPGTVCEVQVKTLLQHAHSELTHNTTYKGELKENNDLVRRIARGAAMIESTDDTFELVARTMKDATARLEEMEHGLSKYYATKLDTVAVDGLLNDILLTAYVKQLRDVDTAEAVAKYVDGRPVLIDVIEKHADDRLLFRAPGVLLVFYLMEERWHLAREAWPLPPSDFEELAHLAGFATS